MLRRATFFEVPFARLRANPLAELLALRRAQGAFASLAEGDDRIWFVFGPEGNRPVLTDVDVFRSVFCPVRGPRGSAQRQLTSGLLSMNGTEHRQQRRMIAPPFQRPILASYTPTILAHTEHMLSGWRVGQERDIDAEMGRLVLRITSALLFGGPDVELADHCGGLLDEYLEASHEVGLDAVTGVADSDGYERLLATAQRVADGVRELIEWRRGAPPGPDLLSLLIQAHEAGQIGEDQLLGHTALTYGAAKSTTAHTLMWTLLLVAQHPEVWPELRHDVQADYVAKSAMKGDADDSFEHVIKESMRLLPASVYVQRVTAQPTQLGPFELPERATVVFSQFVSHRIAAHFAGPDRFRPERWRTLDPPPYTYIPFGLGPRLCLGSALAMHVMRLVLGQIWRRYSLAMDTDTPVDLKVVATMLTSAGPLTMRLRPADAAPAPAARLRGNYHEFVAHD